ncbi:DUF5011 domain-containing protein [Listeria ivanovii]|uniref:Putative peptidoglycan linked protein (LPXTG motif) n=1 Tax=Listeria ivanovii (strain ATCC BAA-678 / PAM 55) TaxID=881621 RepID=G2Z9Z4_LISIP|nr:immunoglobulin-like domain-containing protein [Listeria ivanovii]MCJ1718398.1 DUF5011 domain-containing protein [Listeria ivanovii]MCJ1723586.1 DUF5011 domain-containing protein [Listeria ivanovii]MCJ1736070.1 DUF5011 domain-containing protein [Listeria ivanovii]CBW84807.1 Putative peptidoglycan linked protein (LPXTG motif) [Listeria ivanovii subsp. ivanovii PAM 55]
MKKIIALLATLALSSMVVFNFIPGVVASAANTAEKNLTYKDLKSGTYFVGYEDVQLEKGKSYKYSVGCEANVDMTMTNTVTGQSAKSGLFMPNSSGAEVNNNDVTRTTRNVVDTADANKKVFVHTFEFTANENIKADIGVFLTAGSVIPTAPETTVIWKNVLVVNETPQATPPVINATDKTIKQGDAFNPLNEVTATDAKDGDITKDVKVTTNAVDTNKAGVYDIEYSVTNSSKLTTTKGIKVTVEEVALTANTAPVIHAKDQTIKDGDAFDALKGVTATDKEDGDLTAKIKITKDTVKNSEKGVYQGTYTVSDSGNLSASLTIKITVTQDGKLIIEPAKPSEPTEPSNGPNNAKKPTENPLKSQKPSNVTKTTEADVKAKKIPKTGDNSMIWIVLSGLGLAAIGITTYRKKTTR